MKKITFSLLLFSLSVAAFTQTKEDKVLELITAYHQLNEFNGTALVTHNGKIICNKGMGYKNAALKEMNEPTTIFQIGSITKQFTAAVILKLEEQHKLKISDKLSKYFPDYPNGDKITIFHLLTHTAGVFNYTNDMEFMQSEAVKPANREKMLATFKHKPLDFEPGTSFAYSNSGYLLLGYIIEKITGKSYYEVVTRLIFKPLQMKNSGFNFAELKNPDKATGYFTLDEKESLVASLVDSSVSFAAGAIYTNTADMLKWHNALLNNKVVKRSTIEKAFTPFKNKYGFGWIIDSIDKKRLMTHGGGIFGFNANFLRIEKDNTSIILLNNVGNPKLEEITQNILAILYDKPYKLPAKKTEIRVAEEILQKYTGTYEVVPQFQIVVTVEAGQLVAQATGQPKFELFAQKENYFFLKAVEAEVEFIRNEKGDTEKLILYQGGRQTPAKKVK